MKIVSYVGEEILTDLLGVQHPGFWEESKRSGTPEPRKESTAYVEPNKIKQYCCGGFNGGKPINFLTMSEVIANNINKDAESDIVALWHDESQINKYFLERLDMVHTYGSEYAFPEVFKDYCQFSPKIVHLAKDNSSYQT